MNVFQVGDDRWASRVAVLVEPTARNPPRHLPIRQAEHEPVLGASAEGEEIAGIFDLAWGFGIESHDAPGQFIIALWSFTLYAGETVSLTPSSSWMEVSVT